MTWNSSRDSISIRRSTFTICAEGGANRLYDQLRIARDREQYRPLEIFGKPDSVSHSTKRYYESCGVKFSGQDATDLAKCISSCVDKFQSLYRSPVSSDRSLPFDILVLGNLGSMDQGLSLLQQLYNLPREYAGGIRCQVVFYSNQSIYFVLQPGKNVIHNMLSDQYLKKDVRITPLCPAVITTKGLVRDAKDLLTDFSNQIHTNKQIKADTVEMDTDTKVLFTIWKNKKMPSCVCCTSR
ncbi:MAG: hypothetical protein M1816_007275 [Peltula sp. TS41687]|nr:MAG: hypothetical protein M1816_007275 [Peltula sp. TS41687]